MIWEPMTMDEYAAMHKASGANAVKVQDVWWIEARPFFFRPLAPFIEIAPRFNSYPKKALIGGVLHLVPTGVTSNSSMHFFVYDELQDYSLEKLSTKQKWITKKACDNFTAKRITDPNQFIEEAYPIYQSFYDRTKYFYKSERRSKQVFSDWTKSLFRHPKILIMGAYHEGELSAIDISFQVQDTIIDDVFFSDTKSQRLKVTDFLLHSLREAAKSSNANMLFRGFPSGKRTLDESKVTRGCKVLKLPAHCRINPLALYVGKAFMNQSYQRLIAMTSFSEAKQQSDESQ